MDQPIRDVPRKPPDPPLLSQPMFSDQSQQDLTQTERGTKRTASDNLDGSKGKKSITNIEQATASIQSVYTHPSLSQENRSYGESDCGPYVVHLSRIEPDPATGSVLRPMKIGLFLVKNKVENISKDGIKSVGRNRVSVQFKNRQSANNFISHSLLAANNLSASIPAYNISRMGVIRNIPVDLSMEDLVSTMEVSEGSGKVLKARRLNRKKMVDGTPEWVPTQSVVVTFEGQRLPQYVYAAYNSLTVEAYQLPTIQCYNCCRFGHTKNQCRSRARCFRCSKEHPGDSCEVPEEKSTCLYCSGSHFANDKCCPEQFRQKHIKSIMSEQGISYIDASSQTPKVRRSYADVTSPHSPPQIPPTSPPKTVSYRKTVFTTPHPRVPLSPSFDRQSYQAIIGQPPSSFPNGSALGGSTPNPNSHNENLLELVFSLLNNIISKWSDHLPNNVAEQIVQLYNLLPTNNGLNDPVSPME